MSVKKAAPDFADVLIPASTKESFLIKVEQVIDWQPIEKMLTKAYRRIHNAAGRSREA